MPLYIAALQMTDRDFAMSRFVPYSGEGFALLLPSKYNPSKEKEYPWTDPQVRIS